ncbi:MAG: phospho-N-acetylmuramoyl-pentapeptide-transferase [Eubacteriales bacterium]|nr:phospho-N-acetylmuramoyl-pentapeptide-transferase [Eubacteriales bacterium]
MNETVLAGLLGMAATIAVGPVALPILRKLKCGQSIREEGPKSHQAKSGTPTMGGVMFLLGAILGSVFLFRFSSVCAVVSIVTMVVYGVVGFLDDFIKVRLHRNLGLKAWQKLVAQFGAALLIAIFARQNCGTDIYVPFAAQTWDLGWFYIPFTMFVIIALVNSVNLTDGLDGLAGGMTSIVAAAIGLIILKTVPALTGTAAAEYGNLAIFAFALAGSCLAFLAFNFNPAKVFMGDTGSLALGGALSALFIFSKMTILIPLMGGMFMLSSISDIIQVVVYKWKKKRVFRMAPLHHHFELGGMPETKVVIMYYIITVILCAAGYLIA